MRRPRRGLGFGLGLIAALALALGAAPASAPALAPDPGLAIRGLRVLDGEGWHPDPEFRLDWDGPAGQPAPRVVAVDYLIRDADGTVVVPAARLAEENPRSLIHLHVPPLAGEYTIEVWLEGEHGEGPHAAARLRFDPGRPGPTRPLAPGGWVRAGGPVTVAFEHPAEPWPVSGIRGYAISVDRGAGSEPCAGPDRCSAEETDLAGGAERDSISIGPLPEGTSTVRAVAVSGAGMRSERVETAELRADGTGPEVALDPVPAGWASGPVTVSARARDSLSGMAPDGPAGARTAIAVDGETVSLAPGPSASAVVHGEGVHLLASSARDAVGNPSSDPFPGGPSTAIVRIDETPPQVAFVPGQDPAEPERLEALVADSLSGPDARRGAIAVRPRGSHGPFAPLPTVVSAGRLRALWDSDSYPPGSYEFEATGYDAAGNRATSGRRAGGAPMVLSSPLKAATELLAGFGGPDAAVQRCRRRRGRIRCHRHGAGGYGGRPPLRSSRYGQRVTVGGRLLTGSGSPLGAERVSVIETFDAGAAQARRETAAETAADGTFLVALAAGPSRRVEVEFGGTPLLSRAHSRSLRLAVRAPVRLRASAPVARVGGAPVVFSGSVGHDGGALPSEGLLVALEFRIGTGPWSEFRTVQTGARGRFRYPYAFADDDSRGVRFQFRASIPRQPGWPFAAGASLPVTVTGR